MARKRRKRTNSNVPAKGRLQDIADDLWSLAVRGDWGNRCAVCGKRSKSQAHHLIPRQHEATRYDLRNGCCLCAHCHTFNPDTSPHLNAAGWLLWLSCNWPELHQWYTTTVERGDYRRFDGLKTAAYYCDVIRRLREYVEEKEYDQIVGIRFGRWLEEQENTDEP